VGPEHEKILPERQQAGNHDARQQRHQHRSAGIQALQPLHVANGVIVAKFRGQRKGGLDAEHTKQPGDHAGKPPLRHGHAIGHERADQQDRQIEQGQIGGARHRKRNGLAKLADNPAPRRCHARLAQVRKQPRSVDCQKPDRGDHLRGGVSEGDGQQATRRDDCDELGELPEASGVEAFTGFVSAPTIGAIVSVVPPRPGPKKALLRSYRARADEFLLVTGEAAHFLLQEPTVAPCAGHDWVTCKALGQSKGPGPILARSVEPKSFFMSGEDHHCAHRLMHDRREERCLVMAFEGFLCCRACALQGACWSEAELGGLPCGVAPLAQPKVASSDPASAAARP